MKITIIVLLSINVALTELNSTNHINRGLISNGVVYDPEKYPYLVTVVSYDIDDFHNLCSGNTVKRIGDANFTKTLKFYKLLNGVLHFFIKPFGGHTIPLCARKNKNKF
ncbi:hypothetical protein QTP88_020681 [Uroleucon formosanum]